MSANKENSGSLGAAINRLERLSSANRDPLSSDKSLPHDKTLTSNRQVILRAPDLRPEAEIGIPATAPPRKPTNLVDAVVSEAQPAEPPVTPPTRAVETEVIWKRIERPSGDWRKNLPNILGGVLAATLLIMIGSSWLKAPINNATKPGETAPVWHAQGDHHPGAGAASTDPRLASRPPTSTADTPATDVTPVTHNKQPAGNQPGNDAPPFNPSAAKASESAIAPSAPSLEGPRVEQYPRTNKPAIDAPGSASAPQDPVIHDPRIEKTAQYKYPNTNRPEFQPRRAASLLDGRSPRVSSLPDSPKVENGSDDSHKSPGEARFHGTIEDNPSRRTTNERY